MYVFLDESGDLGHRDLENPVKSPYFVLCGICTQNPKSLAKAVLKVRQTLRTPVEELKFSKSDSITKRRLLEKLSDIDFSANVIVVDKRTVFPTLMDSLRIASLQLYSQTSANTSSQSGLQTEGDIFQLGRGIPDIWTYDEISKREQTCLRSR